MRVLVVSPFLYGRLSRSGGEALGRAMLERLAAEHSVTLVAFTSDEPNEEIAANVAELSEWLEDVQAVARRPSAFQEKVLSRAAILWGEPSAPVLYQDRKFNSTIRASLASFPPDVVIVQFPELAPYVRELSTVPTLLDVVDAYSVSKFRRCIQAEGMPKLIWSYAQWLAWARYERRHYSRFDTVFTLTDQDTYGLKLFNPGLSVSTVGAAFDLPEPGAPPARREPFDIGFAASFAHRPNLDAIDHFIINILPEVRRRVPQARFVIAGRNPPPHLIDRASEGVECLGFVPDIYEFFQACAVVAVPLLWGGGIKVKVVQALMAGAPIVSTSVGVEGTGAINGKHLLIDDSARGFAAKIVHLLEHPNLQAELSEAARSFGAAEFSWNAKMKRVEHALETARAIFRERQAAAR